MGEIRPQVKNANRHTQRGMQALETSIAHDGWIGAITVAADGETFDGSARVEKTAENGMLDDAIVVDSDGTKPIVVRRTDIPTATDPRAVRLGVAANRVASLNLEWEPDVLAGIADSGVDLSSLFTDVEWADVTMPALPDAGAGGDEFDTTPDDGPTRTALGELWSIGGVHRLLVGDCTDAANVARLMGGERAQAGVIDPPYGINIVGGNNTAGNFPGTNAPRLKAEPIIGDDKPFDPSHLLGVADTLVLWGANHYADKLPASSKWLIWDKKDGAFRESDLGDCELAWTNQKGAARLLHHTWQGMYRKGEGERAARMHPTQKPVDLIEWCFDQCGVDDGAIVLDLYLGSGTTLIAAHRTGHRCYGMEISPRYADVILRRAEAEGLECIRDA